jgi:phosphoenolpyruvate carboxylase
MMKQYAELCPNEDLRKRLLGQILTEYQKTLRLVHKLFGREFDSRRPRMEKTLAVREGPLKVLHEQQIALIKRWREAGSPIEAKDGRFNRDFLALQLTINAISSGLRETG